MRAVLSYWRARNALAVRIGRSPGRACREGAAPYFLSGGSVSRLISVAPMIQIASAPNTATEGG